MKIIKIRHPYQADQIPPEDVVLVLGFFDGVHLGHQRVINRGKEIAKKEGLKLALMTFNQHPSIVFKKINPSQVEFVDQYIVGLHAKYAVSGFDYTYGPKEIADVAHLPSYAKNRFEIITVPKEEDSGEKISSTRIRELLNAGEINEVTRLLGAAYEVEGVVVHGDARGRLLGFPTANIKVKSTVHLPKEGVYVSEIKVGETWYQAMGSIGHNDTFGDDRELPVELYILNFAQDIYGEHVKVRWHHFLRNQVKFPNVESLIEQLKADEKATADYFK